MSLTKMNVMRAVASDAAPAKRMPPIGTNKRPVARRRVMRSMAGCCPDLKLKNLAAPLMRTSRSQRVAIFMILSGFGFEVAMGTSGYNGSRLLATSIRVAQRCGLQTVDESHHPVALVRIWQAAAHCTEVVGHVRWVRRTRNNCSHPFISEQVFEKKLGPAASEVVCPIRNRPAAHGAEEAATTERLGGQHARLDLGRQRQDALLRFPSAE